MTAKEKIELVACAHGKTRLEECATCISRSEEDDARLAVLLLNHLQKIDAEKKGS